MHSVVVAPLLMLEWSVFRDQTLSSECEVQSEVPMQLALLMLALLMMTCWSFALQGTTWSCLSTGLQVLVSSLVHRLHLHPPSESCPRASFQFAFADLRTPQSSDCYLLPCSLSIPTSLWSWTQLCVVCLLFSPIWIASLPEPSTVDPRYNPNNFSPSAIVAGKSETVCAFQIKGNLQSGFDRKPLVRYSNSNSDILRQRGRRGPLDEEWRCPFKYITDGTTENKTDKKNTQHSHKCYLHFSRRYKTSWERCQ